MAIKFQIDEELKEKAEDIVKTLPDFSHVDLNRVIFMRSRGSSARGTIARCYGLSKIWQIALNTKAHYVIEVISEKYDRLSEEEKIKTLIHELMHIPFSFGGGFKHHSNWVTERRVNRMYDNYIKKKKSTSFPDSII